MAHKVGNLNWIDFTSGESLLMTRINEQNCKFFIFVTLFCFRVKSDTVHKVQAANKAAKALASDRRDEMRYLLRAKLSQENYLDKNMKKYHYGNSGVPTNTAIQNINSLSEA